MEDKHNNRVYINPNYATSKGRNSMPLSQHNTIYINQNFVKNNEQTSNVNKIFVNPHFIKSKNFISEMRTLHENNLIDNQTVCFKPAVPLEASLECYNNCLYNLLPNQIPEPSRSLSFPNNVTESRSNETGVNKSRYSLVRNSCTQINQCSNYKVDLQDTHSKKNNTLQLPIVKSRYHLIRKNVANTPTSQSQTKSRLKINKYKMITINNVQKSNENNVKEKITKFVPFKNIFPTEQKLIRNSISMQPLLNRSLLRSRTSIHILRQNQKLRRIYTKQRYRAAIENIKGKTKINNIPCPLFSKYGKCLRNIKGNCEYLHNKKHVTLCRKFLKGICHDDTCCFSHELSMKKMPTCNFYLKGICVKENCPYLHVKLSEKAKICQDFVRGYCEKGENCLFRHIKPMINRKSLQSKVSPNSVKKNLLLKKGTQEKVYKRIPLNTSEEDSKNIAEVILDSRYFKETVTEEIDNCNVIKPTRCKLGDLPSFIKLL
ncbi:uncharacterized protein LOC123694637 [Colias croceus]|uniref:uncharacterized protein LOC123694637 n=1 Tax=Colias crocea TaxID=72248 RepID=UPI001E27C78F|nr:uncharacterized protein LOC123694637 [Colias croceus]